MSSVLSVVPLDSQSAAMASLETGLPAVQNVLVALPSTDSLLQAALSDTARNPASLSSSTALYRDPSPPQTATRARRKSTNCCRRCSGCAAEG